MSLVLQNISRFTNVSQKMVAIELQIEKSKLKPGVSLRSDDFHAEGVYSWYFQLALTKTNQISLWLRSRGLVDINICYVAMIFDEEKESLHRHMSSFSLKDFLYINMLDGFSIPFSTLRFPLIVLCYLVIQSTNNELESVRNTDQEIASTHTRTTDKDKVQLDQKFDKDVVPLEDAAEVVTRTNNYENIQIDCLQELSANFGKLLEQSTGTDITIHVDSVSMKAHKMILRARSPVFDKMFDHDTSEANQKKIDIKDIRAPIMKELLAFLYTGIKKKLDFDVACDLYYAADKYEVLSLRNACKKDLLSQLKVDNACQLLSLATDHGDESLKEEIMGFIKTNFEAIVVSKSFEDLAKYDANLVVLLMRNHVLSKSE